MLCWSSNFFLLSCLTCSILCSRKHVFRLRKLFDILLLPSGTIFAGLCLRAQPFYACLFYIYIYFVFVLTTLVNIRNSLISALSLSVESHLADCVLWRQTLISDENISFELCIIYSGPLLQERN